MQKFFLTKKQNYDNIIDVTDGTLQQYQNIEHIKLIQPLLLFNKHHKWCTIIYEKHCNKQKQNLQTQPPKKNVKKQHAIIIIIITNNTNIS